MTNHEHSEKHQKWAPVLAQASLNLDFEQNSSNAYNLDAYCDNGIAMPQTKFGFYLKFSRGNSAADSSKPGRFIRLLYVKKHEWKRSIDANKPPFCNQYSL